MIAEWVVLAFDDVGGRRELATSPEPPSDAWVVGYLCPCGDVKAAAEQVDLLLKHMMFPSTW